MDDDNQTADILTASTLMKAYGSSPRFGKLLTQQTQIKIIEEMMTREIPGQETTSKELQDKVNASLSKTTKQDEVANKILRERKPGEEISVKDIKRVYGKNWKKSLMCIPLPDQVAKRDKKKAKQARKSRQKNRRNK